MNLGYIAETNFIFVKSVITGIYALHSRWLSYSLKKFFAIKSIRNQYISIMKPILLLISCLCLFACSGATEIEPIKVEYNEIDGISFLFSNPAFSDVEITLLENSHDVPAIELSTNLMIKNGIYYITGYHPTNQVHLFDTNGKYVNSVGRVGRGPEEYLSLTDVVFDDNGDISIYSGDQAAIYTYASNGQFIQKVDAHHQYANFTRIDGFHYYFFGQGNGSHSHQLYITDEHGQALDSCLTASQAISMSMAPPFYNYKNAAYLCDPVTGYIYQCKNGKIDVAYNFDFGKYTVPDAFFDVKDPMESFNALTGHTVAFKVRFFKARQSAALLASVSNSKEGWYRTLYGILTESAAEWKWFYLPHNDIIANAGLAYMDDSALYFMIDPILLREAGLTERFPILNDTDENSNPVIIKCTIEGSS